MFYMISGSKFSGISGQYYFFITTFAGELMKCNLTVFSIHVMSIVCRGEKRHYMFDL